MPRLHNAQIGLSKCLETLAARDLPGVRAVGRLHRGDAGGHLLRCLFSPLGSGGACPLQGAEPLAALHVLV